MWWKYRTAAPDPCVRAIFLVSVKVLPLTKIATQKHIPHPLGPLTARTLAQGSGYLKGADFTTPTVPQGIANPQAQHCEGLKGGFVWKHTAADAKDSSSTSMADAMLLT